MSGSKFALTLSLCGLLFGCGGQPGDEAPTQGQETPDTQGPTTEDTDRPVSAFATDVIPGPGGASDALFTDDDNLYARDNSADGLAAVAQLNFNGQIFTLWNRTGVGNGPPLNLSFASGTILSVRACIGSGQSLMSCNGWYTVVAR
ncbi:hypothetical protein D7V88_39145 [Corallococcus terminator]|uniref:Uncharacterized protein n=2 Tax=Corallococcus terminator TaxID=2316733 RepID=A0A3A8HLV2_9BACT|nr:hypothetical protein D7V88_39145 [Corallococcus terminator]